MASAMYVCVLRFALYKRRSGSGHKNVKEYLKANVSYRNLLKLFFQIKSVILLLNE